MLDKKGLQNRCRNHGITDPDLIGRKKAILMESLREHWAEQVALAELSYAGHATSSSSTGGARSHDVSGEGWLAQGWHDWNAQDVASDDTSQFTVVVGTQTETV